MKKIIDGKEIEVNENELGEMMVWNEAVDGGMTMDDLETLAETASNSFEYIARLRDPKMIHVHARRSSGSGGGTVQGVKVLASINVNWYILKAADGTVAPVAQALLFPKNKWTLDATMNWLSKNKIQTIFFDEVAASPPPEANSLRHLMSAMIKKDKLNGKDHFVVPTILMTVGVHNDIFYTEEELSKFPQSWNGRPIVIWHPELNGKPVTANSPEIFERQTTGNLYECTFSDGKLKGDCWIDIEKCATISPEVLKMLDEEKPIEVSTGLFVEDEKVEGVWNGEKYLKIAHHYRPDHLALLPGGKGACSWEDGAGMPRLNEAIKKEEFVDMKKYIEDIGAEDAKKLARALKINEVSHDDIRSALCNLITPPDPASPASGYTYVRSVFGDYFIYVREPKSSGTSKMFKQMYKIGSNDKVSLEGEPVEVEQKISFVPVVNMRGESGGQNATKLKEGGSTMDRTQKVEALIAAGKKPVAEKAALIALSDAEFAKIEEAAKVEAPAAAVPAPVVPEVPAVNAVPAVPASATPAPVVPQPEVETLESVLKSVKSPELRASIEQGLKLNSAVRSGLIGEIMTNKMSSYTKEQLEAKATSELETLARLAGSSKTVADFSMRSPATVTANAADGDVPSMPQLFAKKA